MQIAFLLYDGMTALDLIEPLIANSLQLGIEYDPQPPFDGGSPEKANPAILEAVRSRLVASFESQRLQL